MAGLQYAAWPFLSLQHRHQLEIELPIITGR